MLIISDASAKFAEFVGPPARSARPRAAMTACVVGHASTPLGRLGVPLGRLLGSALERALAQAGAAPADVDGLIVSPTLASPPFMAAHHLAQLTGVAHAGRDAPLRCRTIECGGASPIVGLLEASRWVEHDGRGLVAVVAGDAVASMATDAFIAAQHADDGWAAELWADHDAPVAPRAFDRTAQLLIREGTATRRDLAAVPVLMSRHGARHPDAMAREPIESIDAVLAAREVAPATTLLECARRADGAACVLVAPSGGRFASGVPRGAVTIRGGGEASGLMAPPADGAPSGAAAAAAREAYALTRLLPAEIDYFGIYDCFPACFLHGAEAVGIAPRGGGGAWVRAALDETAPAGFDASAFPVNTHGGLLAGGAPCSMRTMHALVVVSRRHLPGVSAKL